MIAQNMREGFYFQHPSLESPYHINAQLEYTANYVNGILEGTSSEYSEKGVLVRQGQYLQGRKYGLWKKFNKKGKVVGEDVYK